MKTSTRNKLKTTEEGRERLRVIERAKWQKRKQSLAKPPDSPEACTIRTVHVDTVAIDGEGATLHGRHRYTLFGSSSGNKLISGTGLSTDACLQFILKEGGGRRAVGFCINYDVNMWLQDLTPDALRELVESGTVFYTGKLGRYYIRWRPGHTFTVAEVRSQFLPGSKQQNAVTVWDLWGLCQMSFVNALEHWGIGTEEEREYLQRMKAKREGFQAHSAPVTAYNHIETKLLLALAHRFDSALCSLRLHTRRRDGAGALAAYLMAVNGVKEHYTPAAEGCEIMQAYYGGRSQALQIGRFDNVTQYDLNSAYPTAICNLPTLKGTWRRVKEYEPGARYAIWKCSWNLRRPRNNHWPLTPFPWRDADGAISYPSVGTGWYWSPLVAQARAGWGTDIEVQDGYVFEPESDALPFGWVGEWYTLRQQLKRAKDPRERLVKAALNALYGKMAQGASVSGCKPPYQSFTWAGLVTASIQGQLLRAALTSAQDVIAFTVDALWCRRPLPLPVSNRMGEWSERSLSHLLLWGPNSYATMDSPGDEWSIHFAGLRPAEVPLQILLTGWEKWGYMHQETVTTRRFLGAGLALARDRMGRWGDWIEEKHTITCAPGQGFPGEDTGPHSISWLPPERRKGELPYPYVPKHGRQDLARPEAQELALAFDQPEPVL